MALPGVVVVGYSLGDGVSCCLPSLPSALGELGCDQVNLSRSVAHVLESHPHPRDGDQLVWTGRRTQPLFVETSGDELMVKRHTEHQQITSGKHVSITEERLRSTSIIEMTFDT